MASEKTDELERLRSELLETRATSSTRETAAWASGYLEDLPARLEAEKHARALLRELIFVRDELGVMLDAPDEDLRARVEALLVDLRHRVSSLLAGRARHER